MAIQSAFLGELYSIHTYSYRCMFVDGSERERTETLYEDNTGASARHYTYKHGWWRVQAFHNVYQPNASALSSSLVAQNVLLE